MNEDEKRKERFVTDNEKDHLKLPETDGLVSKSLSEQNVSNVRKVSVRLLIRFGARIR